MDGRRLTIDEILVDYVGQFGWKQQQIFFLTSLIWLPAAFVTLCMSFAGKDVIEEHLWTCTAPDDAQCAEAYNMDDPNAKFCELNRSQWEWTVPKESIMSDFELQCDNVWKVQFANSAFFFGFLFGAVFWGVVADKYGRRGSMFSACLASAICTGLNAAAPGYTSYLFLRSMTGFAIAGPGIIAFVLASEVCGPDWRGVVGIATQFFWAGGCCLLPALAYWVPQWRHLLSASALAIGSVCVLWPLVTESPRWLLMQGRQEEARRTLQGFADGNKTVMPSAALAEPSVGSDKATLRDTMRVPILRQRMLILLVSWCVVSCGYYGVSMALDSLGGSIHVNFFAISAIEFPAYIACIALINKIGRKALTVGGFLLCGTACILVSLPPPGVLRTVLAVIGKCGAASAFITLFIYTSELFPTVVRSAALGANSSAARFGGILAPLVVLIAQHLYAPQLPFLVFGVTALGAAAVCTLLPETMGMPLLDSLEDAQGHGHDREYMNMADSMSLEQDDGLGGGPEEAAILDGLTLRAAMEDAAERQ